MTKIALMKLGRHPPCFYQHSPQPHTQTLVLREISNQEGFDVVIQSWVSLLSVQTYSVSSLLQRCEWIHTASSDRQWVFVSGAWNRSLRYVWAGKRWWGVGGGGTVPWLQMEKEPELMAALSPQFLFFWEKGEDFYTFRYSPTPSPFSDPYLPTPFSSSCCYWHEEEGKFLSCNFTHLMSLSLSSAFLFRAIYHWYTICMYACVKSSLLFFTRSFSSLLL